MLQEVENSVVTHYQEAVFISKKKKIQKLICTVGMRQNFIISNITIQYAGETLFCFSEANCDISVEYMYIYYERYLFSHTAEVVANCLEACLLNSPKR